jgi:putative restriction endonuclease
VQPYIALTDKAWFDFLSTRSSTGAVDEVNFWSPKSMRPMKRMEPGEPVFFRLKRPDHAIVGYAFFAHFRLLDLDTAWELFDWKNGDPDKVTFFQRIGDYRGVNLFDPQSPRHALACTILRAAVFWPEERWIEWGDRMGWPRHTQQGNTETDPARIELLHHQMASDAPEELRVERPFEPLAADDRQVVLAAQTEREGQGTFRARLLDAYGGRCAITGEHTEPVLDAAHIQPYLGPRQPHAERDPADQGVPRAFRPRVRHGHTRACDPRVAATTERVAQWQAILPVRWAAARAIAEAAAELAEQSDPRVAQRTGLSQRSLSLRMVHSPVDGTRLLVSVTAASCGVGLGFCRRWQLRRRNSRILWFAAVAGVRSPGDDHRRRSI